tara:strand:- start:500 stop:1159 length:660 start_codon:yes stop_codon:yes gene_type:complete
MKLNIGCGQTIMNGWVNIDNSMSIKLAKLPLLFPKFLLKLNIINKSQFNLIFFAKTNKILSANCTNLPFNSNTVDVIYSSHMMEHLSRDDAAIFIKECLRVLKIGGALRLSLPDLKIAIDRYIDNGDADFFMECLLMEPPKTKSIKSLIKLYLSGGYRNHCWMYDGNSLLKLLESYGFKNSVIMQPGDTGIKNVEGLNLYERSEDSLYVETFKPQNTNI